MIQGLLFPLPEMPEPPEPATTAIYKNRLADKAEVEAKYGWSEWGDSETRFVTRGGIVLAIGWRRISYSDHGPYVEFLKENLVAELAPHFPGICPPDAYYEWLEPVADRRVKVYAQRRGVWHLPNPPAGGFRGNRREGYADYRPGRFYVAVSDFCPAA